MEKVIQVENLVRRYGSLVAVNGVSFEVDRGEVFGILGPNGAGKTTILETIEGLQRPTSGRTLVLGMETYKEPLKVKARIGVQLQASAYFDYLTLTEILELFGRLYPQRIPARHLLEQTGLAEKANATVSKLSGGQKQRFTIAAALVNDPEVVFLDEPTTGLDPQARRQLWEFIQQIHREGRTVILTTHFMEEAELLCQRVAILDKGMIVALDTPAHLVRNLPAPYEIKLLAEGPLPAHELEALDGVVATYKGEDGFHFLKCTDTSQTLPALLRWAESRSVRFQQLQVVPATLEDVFLTLTGNQLRD